MYKSRRCRFGREAAKAKQNAEYLEKLQRGISALNAGKGIEHEIIEDIDE